MRVAQVVRQRSRARLELKSHVTSDPVTESKAIVFKAALTE